MLFNLPLKPYLDLIYRRRWWLILPTALGIAIGVVLLVKLPKVYEASTTILVTPQRVPQEFVKSSVTSPMGELSTLAVQIKSRKYMETIAREFHLVPPNSGEDVVAAAAADLNARVSLAYDTTMKNRDPEWFQIIVDDAQPQRAADIANRLASLFIQQNSSFRQSQAGINLQTAQNWLREIKAQLEEKEQELAKYSQGRLWEMPDQLQTNMRLLDSTNLQIQSITSEIEMRNANIAQLRIQAASAASAPGAGPVPMSPDAQKLMQLQTELNDLSSKYTEDYPDVVRKRAELLAFLKLHPELQNPNQPGTPSAKTGQTPYDAEIARVQAEIANLERQKQALQGQIGTYQSRIASTPERQQDPAAPPALPAKPNPFLLVALGLVGGAGIGAGTALMLELANTRIRTEEEFRQAFPELPLLAAIPDLDDPRAYKRRGPRRGLRRAAAALVTMLAVALWV